MPSTALVGIGSLVTNDPELGDGMLGLLPNAAVVVEDGVISWVGPDPGTLDVDTVVDLQGRAVLPGFVDSHAHPVFAGDRAEEFSARMAGRSYSAGGIRTTVAATRDADDDHLRIRLNRLAAEFRSSGVTTFEAKSGYGLTVLDEARSLRLAREVTLMIATEFPTELNGMFKNVENKGNPWGMNASQRNAWIEEVDFEVRVFGMDGEDSIPDDVDYLFWVGCAGAFEDRAKRTTKAVAELLHIAGVNFMVLGEGETCTGDPARRAGNEFLFQMQAMQNVEVLNEIKATKIVVTCPHCLNTLKREYPQLGGNYEVVHHTQLLNDLVKAGRLTPVASVSQTVTYHDPCYLGRHNNVYVPPRDLISATGATSVEMPRHGDKSFCCGAGGARMWMEEKIGQQVNKNRGDEAIATGAAKVAVACPFCSVMLNDAVTARQGEGLAEGVEVVDVATLLLDAAKS